MSTAHRKPGRQAPEGYAFVDLLPAACAAPLRLCALFCLRPDPAAGHWVVLRHTLDGDVRLGAVVDRDDTVQRWVEILIQNTESVCTTPDARRRPPTNAMLDERWRAHFRAWDELEPDLLVRTGYETEHPLPVYVTTEEPRRAVHPAYEGQPWQLCTDDALLLRHGLPAYTSSPHRYWHVAALGEKTPFTPVNRGAPVTGCWERERALAAPSVGPALNPQGGLLMVRSFAPLSLLDCAEVVGGRAWDGWRHGKTALTLDTVAEKLKDTSAQAARRFFFARQGATCRLLEVFYLKVRMLADAVEAVRALTEQTRRPLLNITADHFAVHLGAEGGGLPLLWNARVSLRDGGAATALPGSGATGWMTLGDNAPSVYRPARLGQIARGQGRVRIRKVETPAQGAPQVEGIFETRAMPDIGRNDRVWLRLPLPDGPLDLYARAERDPALANGEWRFRLDRVADESQSDALPRLAGVSFADVPFEILPQWSSACDLYALGVVAAAVLLGNRRNDPATAWDGMISLARKAAETADAAQPLAQRIGALRAADATRAVVPGPERLLYESCPTDAADETFLDLWLETLALTIACIPGPGPDRRCRDFSDAPEQRPQAVLEEFARGLDMIALQARSRLINETGCNREIRERIRNFRRES
jgi:hypothetical protein